MILVGLVGLVSVPPRAAAAPAADRPPPELLVSVAIGPVTTRRDLQAYIEAVKPGAGAVLGDAVVRRGMAEAVGASSLDGFDPSSWTYALIASLGGAPAIALLGKVADARTLATSAGSAHMMVKGGWAVIGDKPLLQRVGPYALAKIATQRAPATATATVYIQQVLARYKTEIDAVRAQMLASISQPSSGRIGQFLTAYVDGLASLITDTDKLVVTLEATPALAGLDIALVPRPGSRLAKFVAAQRPSSFAMLDRLPQGTPMMLVAGHLELGPYGDGMLDMMAGIYGLAVRKELHAAMGAFRKTMTGDLAMAMRFGPGADMAFTHVLGLSDPAAADKAIAAMLDLFKDGRSFDMMGVSSTITTNAGTTAHDGVTLRSYDTTYDLSKVPAAQRASMEAMMPAGGSRVQIATVDALGVLVTAADSLAEARRAIDAVRGKSAHFTAPAMIDDLVAASRAHKDSVAMIMDLGSLMARFAGRAATGVQPIAMALGAADGNAHIRLAAPAATLRAAVNAAQP